MSGVSRRGFLATGAGAAGAALLPAGLPGGGVEAAGAATPDKQQAGGLFPPDRIGIQLYSLADQVQSLGFAKVLEEVARIGFKVVEFAGYTQGTGDISLPELRRLLDANGLKAIGSHVDPSSTEAMQRILEEASVLGIPNVGISFPLPSGGPTVNGWKQLSETYNGYGELAAAQGVGFYLHNHFHEWLPCLDDASKRGEDVLLAETDPRFVQFEMDLYWAYTGQAQSLATPFDPLRDYALKHLDRYRLFHVKDGTRDVTGSMAIPFTNITDAGQGIVPFQEFFEAVFAVRPGEVLKHHYIWERDNAADHPRGSFAAARASFAYIRYGLTGPNAPAATTSNDVAAAVSRVALRRSKTRRPYARITVAADEPVAVTARVVRGTRVLGRRSLGQVSGRRTFDVRLARGTRAGNGRLEVTFTRASGATSTVRLPVTVPA